MERLSVYDTTLRDGSQRKSISFSTEDKLRITAKLDKLGIDYIEGGWPGSNPKDIAYFEQVQDLELEQAKVTAFGSTRRANLAPEEDDNLAAILDSGVEVATIFGKAWDFHVTDALGTTLEENLKMVEDSIRYLKEHGLTIFFDAEHFFDGYKSDSEYAFEVLKAAERGGADNLVLCDTNGGRMPIEIREIITAVQADLTTPLGIHAHNDSDVAVANSLTAVGQGVAQVQGTMNGLGERCGNANLTSIIPNLKLKLGYDVISDRQLKKLTKTTRFINELLNLTPPNHDPYVGESAFAHKGGIHVSAILKNPETYEHIQPELVGNKRDVVVSELAGKSNLVYKAEELGIDLEEDSTDLEKVLTRVKKLEHEGYHFEGAEASFKLLVEKASGRYEKLFNLEGIRIITEKRGENAPVSEASIKVEVNEQQVHTAAEGNGPVNALDKALRKALINFYPELEEIQLLDYKVRVLDGNQGTEAKVRVLIESGDGEDSWGTVGASTNIIEASWQALVDSIEYGIKLKQEEKK